MQRRSVWYHFGRRTLHLTSQCTLACDCQCDRDQRGGPLKISFGEHYDCRSDSGLAKYHPDECFGPAASTDSFNASVTGTTNTAVAWSLSGAGCSGAVCGSLATSSLAAVYTAPLVAPTPPSVTVAATSMAVPSKTASASVTIVPVVVVTVTPVSTSLVPGATEQFSASVFGTSNTAVTWRRARKRM